jgi:hypothetical protein
MSSAPTSVVVENQEQPLHHPGFDKNGAGNILSHGKSTDELLSQPDIPGPGWSFRNMFLGNYEAPEARPWVFMHCVVGICIIHFSISISQEILYTAQSISNSNQRLPMLFNIRAGNAQLAVNIIVSIINFILLPTLGAVCDYTRFRYHVGSAALCLVCIAEFVSAVPSQQVCAQLRFHRPNPNPPNYADQIYFPHTLCSSGFLAYDDNGGGLRDCLPDLVHVLAHRVHHRNVPH